MGILKSYLFFFVFLCPPLGFMNKTRTPTHATRNATIRTLYDCGLEKLGGGQLQAYGDTLNDL